jgi:anti-anti-sigma factor
MDFTTVKRDGVSVCSVNGELDMYATPDFHRGCEAIAQRDPTAPLVVNLEKATYIDSSGIGVLVQIMSESRARKVGFCVCGATGMVMRVFELSRMTSILPMERSVALAIGRVRRAT